MKAIISQSALQAKHEVSRHIIQFLLEPLCAFFDELYTTAQRKDGRLLTFQMLLKEVPKWSMVTVDTNVSRIVTSCDFFGELVTALFLSHIKMLSAIRLGQATIKVRVPRNEKFVHAVLIEAAKEFYENPYIFRYKDQEAKEEVLASAIDSTVRRMLPMKDLLNAYLNGPAEDAPEPEVAATEDIDVQQEDVQQDEPVEEAWSSYGELANGEPTVDFAEQAPASVEPTEEPPQEEEQPMQTEDEVKAIRVGPEGDTPSPPEEPMEEHVDGQEPMEEHQDPTIEDMHITTVNAPPLEEPPHPSEQLRDDIPVNHPEITATIEPPLDGACFYSDLD